jgi:class 3 adenylate cyclase
MQKTISYVNQLRQTLQAIKENNILKMYVDENVLKFMTHPEFESSLLANETIEATVAFFDICGFTAITENLSANTVVNLINNYFDLMVKEIIAQGGYIDKFIGDAIMAVFRGDYHLDCAIDAALAARSHMQAIPESVIEGITYLPRISIGINTGEMVSGNIGSASLRRLDYTVIGDAVNMAQRFQAAAQPGQIVISEEIYERINESFRCQRIGEVKLKNKTKPVVIYEVLE